MVSLLRRILDTDRDAGEFIFTWLGYDVYIVTNLEESRFVNIYDKDHQLYSSTEEFVQATLLKLDAESLRRFKEMNPKCKVWRINYIGIVPA